MLFPSRSRERRVEILLMPLGTYVSLLSWMLRLVKVCSRLLNVDSSTSLSPVRTTLRSETEMLARSQPGRWVRLGGREERERLCRWCLTRPSRRATSSSEALEMEGDVWMIV